MPAGIVQATRSYEAWLRRQTPLIRADIAYKHELMAADPFSFFRATYYRWLQLWPGVCPGPARGPSVLAVGDVHVENFGTWHDAEGRLVWGVNDFDEAHRCSFANDLVRLAASAVLAKRARHLDIPAAAACDAILRGYAAVTRTGGRPFVLDRRDRWLRDQATGELRDPRHFWRKMRALPRAGAVPAEAARLLQGMLPSGSTPAGFRSRRAGVGSLGHRRVVLLADAPEGPVAREAKALVAPAASWATRRDATTAIPMIMGRAVRDPDPTVRVSGRWLLRRLAPFCTRIELADLPKARDEARLLAAMGAEVANVHHPSSAQVAAVREQLREGPPQWLHDAAQAMVAATLSDWRDWRASRPRT